MSPTCCVKRTPAAAMIAIATKRMGHRYKDRSDVPSSRKLDSVYRGRRPQSGFFVAQRVTCCRLAFDQRDPGGSTLDQGWGMRSAVWISWV
jgi:hypothetical protein